MFDFYFRTKLKFIKWRLAYLNAKIYDLQSLAEKLEEAIEDFYVTGKVRKFNHFEMDGTEYLADLELTHDELYLLLPKRANYYILQAECEAKLGIE